MVYSCLGFASSLGARHSGSEKAPKVLSEELAFDELQWGQILSIEEKRGDPYEQLAYYSYYFAQGCRMAQSHSLPLFAFGGDHSIAIATWSAISEAIKEEGDLGLLWFDAHMDAHTPATTESGFIHGMPLAALLGYGDDRLTQLLSDRPKLKPQHVKLIGVRSFEEGERALLEKLGVKVYFMEEVERRGLRVVVQEALSSLEGQTAGYGISFDVDAVDPRFVAATGTPVAGGLDSGEVIDAMELFVAKPPLAFELVEYNPLLDADGTTLAFIRALLTPLVTRKLGSCLKK